MQMKYFMLIDQKFQYMTHFKNTRISNDDYILLGFLEIVDAVLVDHLKYYSQLIIC